MCRSSGGALVVLKKEIGANELKRSRIKAGRQVNKMGTASEQRRQSPGVGVPGLQGPTGMRNISLRAEEAGATVAVVAWEFQFSSVKTGA